MTEDVEVCSLLQSDETLVTEGEIISSDSCLPTAPSNSIYINSNMTVGDNCIYTAAIPADIAGTFPEGTVLQIMPDSTFIAVAPTKDVSNDSTTNNLFKDASFSADNSATQNPLTISNLLVESPANNEPQTAEIPVCSEGNMSDIVLSFLNETDESASMPEKTLNEAEVKELEGMMNASSQSLDLLNMHSESTKTAQEPEQPKADDRTNENNAAETDNSSNNVVMIDVTKPIPLSQNSLIMVNGQKCVLQQDLQTGQVLAYPVREQEKPHRKRGRPRKTCKEQTSEIISNQSEVSQNERENAASEEEKEKGLLEVVNDDGSLVRRSSRKRKIAKVLKDYETGNLKQELGSDVDDDVNEYDIDVHLRKRKSKGPGRPRKYGVSQIKNDSQPDINSLKKIRGRPRKTAVENEPVQAFLVQTADGQTLMMHVPLSCIPAGAALEEVAVEIAKRLNLGLAQNGNVSNDSSKTVQSTLKTVDEFATNNNSATQNLDSQSSPESAIEPSIQDHSIGSTTTFPSIESLEASSEQSDVCVDSSCQDILNNIDPIVGSVCENEVCEVTLENHSSNNQTLKVSSMLPDSIVENNTQYSSLTVPTCSADSFCINIPTSNASVENSPILSLTNHSNGSDFVDDNFNQVQTIENSQVQKDLFNNSDFVRDKVDIRLFLQNIVNTSTKTNSLDCSSMKIQTVADKDCDINQAIVSSNNSLKQFEIACNSEELNNFKNINEQCSESEPNLVESTKDIFETNVDSFVNHVAIEKNCLQTISNVEDDNEHGQDKDISNPTESSETVSNNASAQSSLSQPKILNNRIRTLPTIFPLQTLSSILGTSASNDTSTVSSTTATIIPLSEKTLPAFLPTEEENVSKKCKICQKSFSSEEEIIEHFKTKHPRCICSECNYMAELPYVIKRHFYRHINNGCFCKICGKKYKDHYILKMHMKMVHFPPEVLFPCEKCDKKFSRKAHLKRHLRIHEPIKPYKCPFCEYKGCEKSDITKHLLIHEAPKHKCEVCGKCFRHLKNKELHLKRHSGQRDYKCGVCDFYGYTFTDIRKHIERRHSDAKLFTCTQCGQAYKTGELLKDAKTRHRLSLLPAHLTTLEDYLKHQPVCQDSLKDVLSDSGYEIELAIPFVPNCGPQDTPQQLELGEDHIKRTGQCQSFLLEQGLKVQEPGTSNINKEPPLMEEVPLDILGEPDPDQSTTIDTECSEETLTSLQAGQLVLNMQNGQFVLSGLDDSEIITSDNLSMISAGKDPSKLITLVTSDGKSVSLPLHNSISKECPAVEDKYSDS
ncbi:uncharacterized protein LOC129230441 [Uloborus diversus]|uniref:uncharacterized protein LOC129230441 n=1 Tax=Uloborus diversus TaxID=327109 RepID=UPI002409F25B|nr:uncharacterized protein LOC129230441 [Uloborus diversus]